MSLIERTDRDPLPAKKPKVLVQSHGIKNGPIPKSDWIVDCRVIQNPFRALRGADLPALIRWCREKNAHIIEAVTIMLQEGLLTMHDRRRDHTDALATPFVITFLCAYGQHRSVAMKHILAERIKELGYEVVVK